MPNKHIKIPNGLMSVSEVDLEFEFEGGEDITADELLHLHDGCGVPFGGSCYISRDGKYSGEYNTD